VRGNGILVLRIMCRQATDLSSMQSIEDFFTNIEDMVKDIRDGLILLLVPCKS